MFLEERRKKEIIVLIRGDRKEVHFLRSCEQGSVDDAIHDDAENYWDLFGLAKRTTG